MIYARHSPPERLYGNLLQRTGTQIAAKVRQAIDRSAIAILVEMEKRMREA